MKYRNYFEKKTILITGGSSGIGYALAEKIASCHPRAIILLSHKQEKLQAAADKLKKLVSSTTQVGQYVVDIGDSPNVQAAATDILRDYGAPDIIVNNAGYAHYHLFHDMSDEEIFRHMNVNLIGAMRVTRAFLPAMRARKSGQIVNVASIGGHMMITPNLVYGAAKHGMVAWTEGLAAELKDDNITVQTISPGRVITEFFEHESFQTRSTGAETGMTVSLEKVVNTSLDAIVKQKKLVIVPSYWAFVAWAIRSFPFIVKPLYYWVLQKRIRRLRLASNNN